MVRRCCLACQSWRSGSLAIPGSSSLFDPTLRTGIGREPIVLVVGHEVSGVDPRVVRCCERVVHVPMCGIKTSLNVAVALGIAVYVLRFCAD